MARAKGKIEVNPLVGLQPQPLPSGRIVTDKKNQPEKLAPLPEQTDQQNSLWNGAIPFAGGMPGMPGMVGSFPQAGAFFGSGGGQPLPYGANGGPWYNGWGAIGLNTYGTPFGSFGNYWLMERNPTVALAEATADAPVKAAELTYESKEGTPQEIVDFIRECFAHHERELLDLLVLARGWGFRPIECVYKINDEGKFVPDKFKGLMPDLTQALVDIHGNIVGLQNNGTTLDDTRRFIWLTYDGKGCNIYGRSRKENCKKPWLREEGLYDILEYSMNILVRPFGYVTYPHMANDVAGNNQRRAAANNIANNLASGQWATVPNPYAQWMEEMVQKGIKLEDIQPYKIGWYDAKTDSGDAFERLFKITHTGIVMGMLQPPRTILEGPGTQADAETHTDTAVMVNESFLDKICRVVNCGPIDTVLEQNFGPKFKGCVWWKPAPLVDKSLSFNNELVKSILGSELGPFLRKRVINIANIFEKAGVKIDEFDQEKLAEEAEKAEQEKQAIELQSKQPVKASMGPHKFSTTQIQLDENTADEIRNFAATIPDDELAEDGRETDIHVTVKYGLHTESASDLLETLAGMDPISYSVGKTSLFTASDDRPYDVLKMDVSGKSLHAANRKISSSFENTEKWPTYKPHLTIAYLKPGMGAKYAGKKFLSDGERTANSIMFSSKTGERTSIPLGVKKLSITDDLIDPEHRLTPEKRKRRKQFLLALLAFFAWQADSLASDSTLKANDAKFNIRLAEILARGMNRGEKYTYETTTQATETATQVNATTEKNVATAVENGATRADAITDIAAKSVENRATAIEGDMSHISDQIEKLVDAKEDDLQMVWICSLDDNVCSACSPFAGVVFKAGEEVIAGTGVYHPILHQNCRCEIFPVPKVENG